MIADPLSFRPSASQQWLNCAGSVTLSVGKPDSQTEWAASGSRQHRLAQIMLEQHFLGDSAHCGDELWQLYDSFGRAEYESVSRYVNWARMLVDEGGTPLIEQGVTYAKALGFPGLKGTLDYGVIRADGKSILIADRKFPWGKPVYAEGEEDEDCDTGMRGHPPLMLYALGLLETFDGILLDKSEVERIDFAIFQEQAGEGSVNGWSCTAQYLEAFRAMAWAGIRRCLQAQEHAAKFSRENWQEVYLHAGKTQCKYCKAAGECPALAKRAIKAVAGKEIALEGELLEHQIGDWELRLVELKDADLERRYELIPLVKTWITAVSRQMYDRMSGQGAEMERHKLVTGRQGNRKWSDPAVVEKLVGAKGYERKVCGPAEMERRFKDGDITEDDWAILKDYIERSQGKPTIAPIEDKREEAKPLSKQDMLALLPALE